MTSVEFKVSHRGQMALPAETRRRWKLDQGGTVEVTDLGDVVLITPSSEGGLRAKLRIAIEDAGGYAALAADVAADDPDLA